MVLFILGVLIMLAGCAILFLDVFVSFQTDRCIEQIEAVYVGGGAESDKNRKSGFLMLSLPEFSYVYKKKKYVEKASNVFFHFYLRKGKLAQPFLQGKTYYIYVNPSNPKSFVTDGEQRVPFLRILGVVIAVIGMLFTLAVM